MKIKPGLIAQLQRCNIAQKCWNRITSQTTLLPQINPMGDKKRKMFKSAVSAFFV